MNRWDEDKARELRKNGMSWCALGRVFGVAPETVHMRLDPDYRELKLSRKRAWMKRHQLTAYVSKGSSTWIYKAGYGVSKDVVEARRSEIPDDTRDLTQRVLGDPVFERSALYAKMMEGA